MLCEFLANLCSLPLKIGAELFVFGSGDRVVQLINCLKENTRPLISLLPPFIE